MVTVKKPRGRPKKKQPATGELTEKLYFISLAFGDKIYEGSGQTVLDALQAMPIPVKIVSKGLLKLTDGVKKFEQMWQPAKLKRLFQPLSQAVQAKMLNLLMR